MGKGRIGADDIPVEACTCMGRRVVQLQSRLLISVCRRQRRCHRNEEKAYWCRSVNVKDDKQEYTNYTITHLFVMGTNG